MNFLTFFPSQGVEMNICNKVHFGYMLNTCTENMSLEDKKIMFTDTLVDHMGDYLIFIFDVFLLK